MIPHNYLLFPAVIYEENTGCTYIYGNDVVKNRSNHVDIKYQFIMRVVSNGAVKLQYVIRNITFTDI